MDIFMSGFDFFAEEGELIDQIPIINLIIKQLLRVLK